MFSTATHSPAAGPLPNHAMADGSPLPAKAYRLEVPGAVRLPAQNLHARGALLPCAVARTLRRGRSRPASVAAMENTRAGAVFRARVEDAIDRDDPEELAELAAEVG